MPRNSPCKGKWSIAEMVGSEEARDGQESASFQGNLSPSNVQAHFKTFLHTGFESNKNVKGKKKLVDFAIIIKAR